ncbi:Transposase and inactivated derivatives [Yersinia intermedia]|nr:Transposase and inactivated derivatives [Yersinia intermedia]
MARSFVDENARLRALLDAQQQSLRQMAEYNRLLSQRVAVYASEINRLKALVVKLQRMQFGKSSEKLRQYVLMPGKVHTDDIPVPVQDPGSGKTRTARLWVYVRDDRNAGSPMPL